MKKTVVAVIPSRYGSTRFPGKPLALINNKPMIQWVYEKVKSISDIDEVYVATDDNRIYDAVHSFDGKAIMTSKEHNSGTDRIAAALNKIERKFDIVLNVQGDEPMVRQEMLISLIRSFEDENVYYSTLKYEIKNDDEINDPNIAKVITDSSENAIYFSRSTIPYNRDKIENYKYYKHIGIYAYTYDFLFKFSMLESGYLEKMEQLEQLRAIENGYKVKVIESNYQSIGVDLPEHIDILKEHLI